MHKDYQRRPINLKFGDTRVKLGYEEQRPDGTQMLIASVGDIGLHLSSHPTGLIKISDKTGFEARWNINDIDTSEIDPLYFLETVESNFEKTNNPMEDAIAIVPTNYSFTPPIHETPRFIDIEPLKGFEWMLENTPFWQIEKDFVDDFIKNQCVEGSFIMSPKSKQIALVLDDCGHVIQFGYDNLLSELLDMTKLVTGFEGLLSLFEKTIDHITYLSDNNKHNFNGYYKSQFKKIDFDSLGQQMVPKFEKIIKNNGFMQKYP